jgi:hypothetical protein
VSLPILDPKKVPVDWETDIFGLVYPAPSRVTVTPMWEHSWGVHSDGTPMTKGEIADLLSRWTLDIRPEAEVRELLGLEP